MAQAQPLNQPITNTEDKTVIAIVKGECPNDLTEKIKAEALSAVNKYNTHREIAEYLKKKLDDIDGQTWNVIVGHNFACNVKCIFFFF